jgi:hypothetical protein
MIVTHTSPDWDAIGAVWLLKRFTDLHDAPIVFVNTGNPDPDVLAQAAAAVDTGREYDPSRRRYDHHQFPGADANLDCATSIVFHDEVNSPTTFYLEPLVKLIYDGDTGKPGANESRERGIHALLSAKKTLKWSDDQLIEWGMALLDDLELSLRMRAIARQTLTKHVVYRSDDGLVIALKDAPPHATSAAHEAGARLVLFQSSSEGTNAIGVMRGGEQREPHVGYLVAAVIADPTLPADMLDELSIWYRHEAGFFAGRGTAKAPNATPIAVDLADVARAIDEVWIR